MKDKSQVEINIFRNKENELINSLWQSDLKYMQKLKIINDLRSEHNFGPLLELPTIVIK